MQKFYLKRHKRPYCIEEIAHMGITKGTVLKPDKQDKWIPADQIDELSELLEEQPLSYTGIRKHYKNSYLVSGRKVTAIFFLFALTILFPPIIDGQLEGLHYLFVEWKLIVYTVLIVGTTVLCMYDIMHRRYYRIIKKTKTVHKITEITYEVQTGVSFKKDVSELNEFEIKWRVLDNYRRREGTKARRATFEKLEEAKAYFDKQTVDKLIFEKSISGEKKQYKKPSIFQFLKEKNKTLYFNPVKYNSVFIMLGVFFMVNCSFFIWAWGPIETKKIIIATPLVLLIITYIILKIKNAKSTCYLRIIKRRVKQGLYSHTSYHLQSCITKNGDKAKVWKDLNVVKTYRVSGNRHSFTYEYIEEDREYLMTLFVKKTRDMTPEVTVESIDA